MTRRRIAAWLAGPGLLAAVAAGTAVSGGLLLALAATPAVLERLRIHLDGQPSLVVIPALGVVWAALTLILRPASAGRAAAPDVAPVAGALGAGGRPGWGRDGAAAHKHPAGARDVSFRPGRADVVGAASQPAAPTTTTTLVLPGVTT